MRHAGWIAAVFVFVLFQLDLPWTVTVPVAAVVLVVLTVAAVYGGVMRNLPEELDLDNVVDDDDLPPEVVELVDAYAAAGFARCGPALYVPLVPPALLVPMLRPGEPVYGSVIHSLSAPVRTIHDFVTVFEQGDAVLTTCQDWSAGVLPAGPTDLRQIFQGADVPELYERHRAGVRFLREQGLRPKPARPDGYEEGLRRSFPRNRRVFREARIRNTLGSIRRVLTKRTGHEGPIATQPRTAACLRSLTGALSAETLEPVER